jgi:hypothetical protein
MAELRIERGGIFQPVEYTESQENIGIQEELTSMPEWQGWDRIENCGYSESPSVSPLDLHADLAPVIDQLRGEKDYSNLVDLDEKAFLMDVLNNISSKLDGIVQQTSSEKLQNFQETLNDLLEMREFVYTHQLGSIKG